MRINKKNKKSIYDKKISCYSIRDWKRKKRKKGKRIKRQSYYNLAVVKQVNDFRKIRRVRWKNRLNLNNKIYITKGTVWQNRLNRKKHVVVIGLYRNRSGESGKLKIIEVQRRSKKEGGWQLYENSRRGGWKNKRIYWIEFSLFRARYLITRGRIQELCTPIKIPIPMSELELLPL